MLFTAEKHSLNKYGYPITGDTYIAMKYGTVPSWLYKLTNKWHPGIGFIKCGNSFIAERKPIIDLLSEYDEKSLEHGYNEYSGLSFGEVKDKNHKEPAWIKNWEMREEGRESVPIPFEDLVEEDWLREDLKLTSRTMVI
jgi:uncharacterized phage-associated protein